MLGYIVKILDCPKVSSPSGRPHGVGDYGQVTKTSPLSVEVKTADGACIRYLKGEVEVYSRTPVDLILIGGKSLPVKQAELDDFYSLNKLSTMETQSLEQLKFNKYVEENEGDIVDLSESIDAKLEDLNDLGHTCGDLYITVKTQSAAMSNAFKECNKERLIKHQNILKVYDDLFASKEYAALVEATKALDRKIVILLSCDLYSNNYHHEQDNH